MKGRPATARPSFRSRAVLSLWLLAAFGCDAGSANLQTETLTIVEVDVTGILMSGVPFPHARAKSDLQIFPSDADWEDPTLPSIRGVVERARHAVRFRPRYPFSPGVPYRLVWRSGDGKDETVVREFSIPPSETRVESSNIVAVYPTRDLLPENQLKLYLHFSDPMQRRDPYDYVHLFDAETGEEMFAVFHAMRNGLWDATGTRLTIVFDPGRVKRGLANREAWGPPIVAGRRYRLVVDSDWPTGHGDPLESGFEKTFTVTNADRIRPDPERWSIETPSAGSLGPVVIAFDEPLDHALLGSSLGIRRNGSSVHGSPVVAEGETEWRFTPESPWAPGQYTLVVDCRLEDLAGNNLVRLFDVDLATDEVTNIESEDCPSVVPFSIAHPSGLSTQ